MSQLSHTYSQFKWLDSATHTGSPIEPLAFDEALTRQLANEQAVPLVHLWIYDKGLFLGRRDAALPHLHTALKHVSQQGYGAVLRSSGGACVPLDSGVLNMAVLLPQRTISIDAFFQLAAEMMRIGLRHYGIIEVGEVTGSYCVGEYDFAINGKKIGGMSQRRNRYGSILQLCINVLGSGWERGQLMEQFYQVAGLAEMTDKKPIPYMDASTIGSLEQLSGRTLSMEEVKEQLLQGMADLFSIHQVPFQLPVEQLEAARTYLLDKLDLFAFTAAEIQADDWQLPAN